MHQRTRRTIRLFTECALLLGGALLLGRYVDLNPRNGTIASTGTLQQTATTGKSTMPVAGRAKADLNKLTKASNKISFKGKVTIFDEAKTEDGYFLYPTSGTAEVVLMDLRGKVVNRWPVDAERARLLPNGNLLVIHGSKWGKDVKPWSSLRNRIREYNWDGELVWEYKADEIVHHDVHRLEDGSTLVLRREIVPASFKKSLLDDTLRQQKVRADGVLQISPEKEIIWDWMTYEHLDLNSCGRRECRQPVASHHKTLKPRDWTHVNTASPLPENKWFDQGDERFRPGNILVLPRNWWTIYLVDKKSEKIVWEYGGDYRGGLSGGHEASMIPEGLPGAGNILVLDNGAAHHKGESFVLEIDPTTKKVVWVYDAGKDFFTGTRGLVQRLPNGNTFISEDNTGRLLEVTPEKEVVWEYRTDTLSSRAQRYMPDHCPQLQ